jgi:hypothetical protein
LSGFRPTIPIGDCTLQLADDHYWRAFESQLKKETAMTNGILASEANLTSSGWLSSKSIGKEGKASSTNDARTLRRDKATGRRAGGRIVDQSLLGVFLDPKSSSLSLTALAQAAAFSGKRLILEIRDENPVKIVRTSTRGM